MEASSLDTVKIKPTKDRKMGTWSNLLKPGYETARTLTVRKENYAHEKKHFFKLQCFNNLSVFNDHQGLFPIFSR